MSKKLKQLSYLSAIMISIGTTIGAGIFFKNGSIFSNVGGSLGLMITSWLVAAVGIMALGLALVELSSASSKDGGMLEWSRKFLPKKLSKMSSSYMLLIYLPLNYLAMPIYISMSLQDAIQSFAPDVVFNGIEVGALAFGLFIFAAGLDWIKHSVSEKIQIVISWSKFIPLAMVMVFGIISTAKTGVATHTDASASTSLTAYAPSLGIIASIPAILFAYDGFYAVTALKSDMKDEKKLGGVVVLAISAITGAYVLFGAITGMTGQTDFFGIMDGNKWALFFTNMFIMFAVFAILNGFAMVTYRMYDDVFKEQPLGIVGGTAKVFKITESKKAAFVTSIWITVLFYIALIPVGIYGFDSGGYDYYGETAGNVYNLADMVTNYTSLMAFIIIVGSVFGGLLNRKTNKIKVDKKPYFVPAAIIAIVFASIGAIYMVANNIAGMTGLNGADPKTEITKFIILVVTLTMSVIPVFFSDAKVKKLSLNTSQASA